MSTNLDTMDNAAFQKLVLGRAAAPPSKDDSLTRHRQVVKDYDHRRKRKRGQSGDSSDDSGPDASKNNRKRDDGAGKNSDKKSGASDEPGEGINLYRDRAKERREGKSLKDTTSGQVWDNTPEFKGLDLATVRRQKKSQLHSNTEMPGARSLRLASTRKEAQQWFLSPNSDLPLSSMGRAVCDVLQRQVYYSLFQKQRQTGGEKPSKASSDIKPMASNSFVAAQGLAQTALEFSIHAHPGDFLRSWEIPRESQIPTVSVAIDSADRSSGANPWVAPKVVSGLSMSLIQRIGKSLSTTAGRPGASSVSPAVHNEYPKPSKEAEDVNSSDDDDIFAVKSSTKSSTTVPSPVLPAALFSAAPTMASRQSYFTDPTVPPIESDTKDPATFGASDTAAPSGLSGPGEWQVLDDDDEEQAGLSSMDAKSGGDTAVTTGRLIGFSDSLHDNDMGGGYAYVADHDDEEEPDDGKSGRGKKGTKKRKAK
jgi:hypothetical protein